MKHSLGINYSALFDSGQTQPIQPRIYEDNQQTEQLHWFHFTYAAVAVKISTLEVSALVSNIRPIANIAVKPPM